MYFVILLLFTAKIPLTNQPSPKSLRLGAEMGPVYHDQERLVVYVHGKSETACKRRDVVNVVDQNLGSYRKDFKDGAKGYVL